MIFTPHVDGLDELKPPIEFLTEFKSLTAGIYPSDVIAKLRKDNYDPFIIGYIHDGNSLAKITKRFREIVATISWRPMVALEIVPEQIGWIEEFLRDEKEFKESGTVRGKKPSQGIVNELRSYRPKLRENHSQHLALWLLENGFGVVSIEHKDVVRWIDSDKGRLFNCDEGFWHNSGMSGPLQPGYTAIRRDIHGLGIIEKEHPDIISVGLYHALKYDLLLQRDGQRSFYFVTEDFSWSDTLNLWRVVHEFYFQQRTAAE